MKINVLNPRANSVLYDSKQEATEEKNRSYSTKAVTNAVTQLQEEAVWKCYQQIKDTHLVYLLLGMTVLRLCAEVEMAQL